MNSIIKFNNDFLKIIINLTLYFILFILIFFKFKDLFNPVIGSMILTGALALDYYLAKYKLRIYIRFALILAVYLLLRLIISLFSYLITDPQGYHLFFDKLPYVFFRDTLIVMIFLILYFLFDSTDVIKITNFKYYTSTVMLLTAYLVLFIIDSSISKTIFKNYFNYSLLLIIIVILFVFRHIIFHLHFIKRSLDKKDFFMLIPVLMILVFLFFFLIMPEYINSGKGNKQSLLLEQKIFLFDFSNFLELKDEIKLNSDRVLIVELQGIKDDVDKRISQEWNRQIYLKRFALEEYTKKSGFKISEKYTDNFSPPLYFTNVKWDLEDRPFYSDRIDITETLYLINIDPSALLGSDIMYKVVPLSNWNNSPFKRIYKSYSHVFDTTYYKLSIENLLQEKFTKSLSSERKNKLLYYGDDEAFRKKLEDKAKEITYYHNSTFAKAYAIQEYFRNNYYYSLKPGVSKKVNKLEYFIFGTGKDPDYKGKGYCTYFAFAMTLMLRSIGIVSRVAVGFTPDMENKTLHYYDIRTSDAHAWVEVYFDDYGWITFDPTSSNIAPGENFKMDFGNKEERDVLIEQILKNKDRLKEVVKTDNTTEIFNTLINKLKQSIRKVGVLIFICLILLFIIFVYVYKNIYGLMYLTTLNKRKRIIYLYKYTMARLLDFGYPIRKQESITEFAKHLKSADVIDITLLTEYYQEAIFTERKNLRAGMNELKTINKSVNNEFKKKSFIKKLLAFINISRLWKKILPIVILLAAFNVNYASAIEQKSIYDYINEAKDAIDQGFFDKGLAILDNAEKQFANRWEPNYEKGVIYYNHSLYQNAIIEFLKAKQKNKYSEELYHYLGDSYGSIGDDEKAVKIFEEAFNNFFQSMQLYEKLSWMYFKIYKVDKSIEITSRGLKEYPDSADLMMTLGSMYSTIYDYEKSKKYFLEAIEKSNAESNNFRSICYYNLSLLEHKFLNYDQAFEACQNSLVLKNRSSAHYELNNLYLDALELRSAYNEAVQASGLYPVTMFPKMSLASIYIESGRIDEAITLIKEMIDNKDFSWMLNFRYSKEEYLSELYGLLSKAYKNKYNQIKYKDNNGFLDRLKRPFKRIYYALVSYYYELKHCNLSVEVGEKSIKGGSKLDGLQVLYSGFRGLWPRKALKLLNLSKEDETRLNPKTIKFYNADETILNKRSSVFYPKDQYREYLLKTVKLFDKFWEKSAVAEIYIEIIKMSGGRERDNFIKELFKIHPPYLSMNDFKIKMNFKYNEKSQVKNNFIRIEKSLKSCGIKKYKNSDFLLNIKYIEDKYVLEFYDGNALIKIINVETDFKDRQYRKKLKDELFNKIFVTEL